MRDTSHIETWDGLRGIAILTVLVYHTWLFSWFTPELTLFGIAVPVASPVRTGYLGVELFFVISGFVIFYPYARASNGLGSVPGIAEFARRRFLKIVPSYVLALIASVWATLSLTPTAQLGPSILQHAVFLQNFWNDPMGYGNSVLWSLAVEVQFYVIFPFVAWAFVRTPYVTAAAMTIVAIVYRIDAARCCLEIEPVTRQLPAFLDLFACGMLAAYAFVRLRAEFAGNRRFAAIASAVALGAALAWWLLVASCDTQTYVPGGREWWIVSHRTVFGIVSGVFGLASSLAVTWWRRLLANPVLTYLGLISYNLYLWHTIVLLWMWKHDVPRAATKEPHDDPHWKIVYIASGWALSLIVASAITYFIERPLLGGATRRPFSFAWRPPRVRSDAATETRT